jgi:hypothetical protein
MITLDHCTNPHIAMAAARPIVGQWIDRHRDHLPDHREDDIGGGK